MPADHARIQNLFLAALDLPDEAARAAYLEAACAGDAELRARVEVLLRAHDTPDSLLDAPVVPAPGSDAPTVTLTPDAGATAAGPAGPDTGEGFELGEEVGRGANGVVYRARQRGLNRVVAVKMALGFERAARHALARFLAEAEAVAAIDHPHVVRVYGFGQRDGVPFLAMEYLGGGTLTDRLRAGSLDPGAAAEFVAKVASGVAAAHALGIVHRDLKPGNVLLDDAGEPKVTDFGLARRGAGSDLTRTHAIMGTPAYMAPEQARGGGKFAGPPADVWALGVILYECVAGKRPFEGGSDEEVLSRITAGGPPPLRAGSRAVPRDFDTIVSKCLSPEPEHRYPTAAELADDLGRFLRGEPITARPAGRVERLARWVRRKPTAAAVYGLSALAAALALVVFVVAGLWREAEGAKKDADAYAEQVERLLGVEKGLRFDLEGVNASLRGANLKLETALGGERAAKLKAEQLAEKLARVEYGRTVQVAHQAWRDGDNARARALLESTRADLRGWEWNYTRRLCAGPLATVRHNNPVELAVWSPDGTRIFTHGPYMPPRIWNADGRILFVLEGHQHGILSADWSKDGNRVLTTADRDNPVRVWDATTGKELWGLGGRRAPTKPHAVWSADSSKVAAAYAFYDAEAEVWTRRGVILDAATGKELAVLELGDGNRFDIRTIAWSPDGDRVAAVRARQNPANAVYESKTADVFDAKTGKPLFTLKGHEDAVRMVSFAPDGTKIVTGSYDGTVRWWDANTGKELAAAKNSARAAAVVWSPSGSRFLTTSAGEQWHEVPRDPAVRVWDAATHKELAILQHPADVKSAVWSPDGTRIVTAADGVVWVWDAATGRQVGVVRNHAGGLSVPSFSPDGTRLLTAAYDGVPGGKREFSARVWDARTGVAAFAVPVGRNNGFGDKRYWQSPDGFRVLVGRTLWDVRTGRKVADLDIEVDQAVASVQISSAVWSPDGTRFVTAAMFKPEARVWDATNGKQLTALRNLTESAQVVVWSPDGTRIVIAARDGTLRVWEVATGDVAVSLAGFMPEIASAEWSPDGSRVLAGATDGTLRVWDTKTGAILATPNEPLSIPPRAVSWKPDRSRVVAGGWLWNADTGERVTYLRGQDGSDRPPVWNRDGSLFAAADSGSANYRRHGTARVWDGRTGAEVAVIPPRDKDRPITPRLFAWSPDGSRLATVTDGVRIWDAKRNTEVAFIDGHDTSFEGLAWSPDGKRIVTGPSYDNATTVRARAWDAETGKLVGSLERRQEFFGGVIAHAINRDGSRLATADSNGTVRVWDAKTGKESVVFTRARNISQLGASFHWNPNGDMVVASVGATSVLWDAVAVREVARLEGHPWEIDRVAWSPDGARLATSDRATVLVWDAKTGKNLATLVHRDAEGVADPADDKKQVIHGVAWNPTGTRLATAADGTLRLWDPATGKELTVLAGQAGELSSVVWTADGARFVAAGPDPRVKDAAKGRPVFASEFGWHYSPLEQARRGPDRFRLAPNSDFSLQVTDARTGKEVSVRVFGGHQRRPLDGPNRWWSPDGSRIAALEGTDTVRLWDAATGKALEWLTPSNWFSVHSAAWSPDGTRIVVTGLDSATRLLAQDTPLARVWEVPSAKPEGFGRTATVSAVLKGHTGKIHSATWNRDGRKLVTTSADGTARLYDAATGAEEAVLGGHAGEWIAAAWSPDGSRVATSSDNTVRIWDASTGAELLILVGERVGDLHQTGAPSVRWSPDGWRVSLAPPWSGHEPENGALTIWDATPLDRPAIPPEVAPPPRAKP